MVKIKKGVEIEFVPCPAGTFTMGHTSDPDDIEYKHEVTITRPFWMSKFPITVEQFDAFCPVDKDFQKKYGKQGESKSPACLQIGHVENYCKWLNRRFAFVLPHRCIFRLPTDAEWEYALFANSMDKDDPYVRFRDGEKAALREICGTNLPVTVGTAGKPNAWGIYDMLGNGCHYVLDTISGEYCSHGCRYGGIGWEHRNAHKCGYKEREIDPLRLYIPKDKKIRAWHLMRGGQYSMDKSLGPRIYHRMAECGEVNLQNRPDRPRIWTFRVVVGPDLLKERGIKLPNHGK
jgi:formylglycine-generating enzyme required for sulfatase activity